MDILLSGKDWALDPCGTPISITGWQEERQRCFIRLQIPKGSFPHQPELGSGLCALAGDPDAAELAPRAMELAQEALLPMPYVRVLAAACQRDETGRLTGFLIRISGKNWEEEVLIQTDGEHL